MLVRIIRDSKTQQLTWQRITGDSGAAGATPLGAILAIFSNTVPEGFLPCNGATYDITTYTDLYELLGTSTLPDFRECSLVGIGENSTDAFTTPHDIYTLGQFKDGQTGGITSAGYTVSGNNLVLNNDTTLGAENRKLVHQYVTNANATDLVTGSSVTRARSKGVNFIIKAIPGMETTDITDALALINERLAETLAVKAVDTLPTGADIGNYLYYYNYSYYAPTLNASDSSLNYLTRLANFSEIQPVIEWLASTDPLPTGSAIKEHLYAQEYTTAGGDTKYNYYIGKVDSSGLLNNELVALETGAGSSIFVGTQAEWDALSTAEKNEYSQANITDSNSVIHVPVDVVADGNMNPVTSNAVYDKLTAKEGNLVLASGVTITGGGFARFEQSGNVVIFNFHGLTVTPTGTDWTLLGNLPSNINKPRNNFYSSDVDSHIVLIGGNGTIQLYSHGVTTQQTLNVGNMVYIA